MKGLNRLRRERSAKVAPRFAVADMGGGEYELAVYGEVMSEEAHRLLSDAGLCVKYGTLVPEILNRAGTAPCPMEQAAAAVTDPAEALPVLRQALQELQKQ